VITNKGTTIGSYINAKGVAVGYIDQGGTYTNLPTPAGSGYTLTIDTPTNSGC
jgi:hypothetical protein